MNDREREERAFDALIVMVMRSEEMPGDRLPELNEKERAAMDRLPDSVWDFPKVKAALDAADGDG